MSGKKKIGIIDSGVGGLSILFHLLRMQEDCTFYYQSDHSNVPYGNKKQDFMYSQTALMVEKLLAEKIDLILIACNTLTAETIDKLRGEYEIPFVGIEPYINYVNSLAPEHHAGLILTQATFDSKRFQSLVQKLDHEHKLATFPLANLALIIEDMQYNGIEKGLAKVDEELLEIKKMNLDSLILGCTHYPLIGKYIAESLDVNVIDPHIAVCKRVFEVLKLELKEAKDFLNKDFNYAFEIDAEFEQKSLQVFDFFTSKNGIIFSR
tara:strand:+ start:33329 stop:34123 length:795 start_codon:yes stop_codon:yes gene_type:complete